ncbi:MAG: hypothetical protein JWM10_248 [Myxococcaceae bacterium]|nr:hypothetical protein [Myxococcaceae bacterium]
MLFIAEGRGGSVETFLKAAGYPPGTNWSFAKLIDNLPTIGAPAEGLPPLHVLRHRYNSAKHDHVYDPTVHEVTETLDGAIAALSRWRGLGLGNTEAPAPALYRRMLWLASWDHYVHGDGEVQVFLPIAEDDGEHPPRIDVIYLKGLAWPDVLAPLGTSVSSATGRIPKKFLDSWESEGDCAGARVFEGEYRELLKVLAQAELRLDLIPLLKREADVSAVRTALALAATDVARASAGPPVKDELVTEILQLPT